MEVHLELLVGAVHTLELVDEVHVPRRTTELTVRGGLQADVALEADDLGDGEVLGLPQRVGVDLSRGMLRPGVQQLLGAQQAADVVGAEGRAVSPGL